MSIRSWIQNIFSFAPTLNYLQKIPLYNNLICIEQKIAYTQKINKILQKA